MSVLAPERPRLDAGGPEPQPPRETAFAAWAAWLAATCSLGAAVVHFGYAPAHFSQYWLYGLFFAVVGWAQLLWALAVAVRPRRLVLAVGVLLNAGVIAVWAVTRTVGALVGPSASLKEAATFPDILATCLEAVAVLNVVAVLVGPRLLARRVRPRWLTPVALAGVLAVVGTSVGYALTPHFVNGHVHGGLGADGSSPCEKSGPPATQGQVFNSAGHTHRGAFKQVPVNEATRTQLEAQQVEARAVAARYPTVADAVRGGYQESTVYVPCIGAHYTNVSLAGRFDPAAPSELLYDGTSPASRIVGLSYLVWHPAGAPAGFAGPNDHWHQHNFNGGLCINASGLVVGAENTSRAECARRGGAKIPLTDIWMLHDWVVPGFECSWGVFAAECPELGGRLGGTAWESPVK